jgi:hypothetical protein
MVIDVGAGDHESPSRDLIGVEVGPCTDDMCVFFMSFLTRGKAMQHAELSE